ncbi:LytR/AlgR family response regulator transcription factor [Salmonirosea aquatica]|uniref:Response regulator n=1 Tax=Salmonirosea aquatica TaxID=2654236 RepID=A0A7C9BHK7_9BACT|nr:response regulator [Cytophagaceae bacterium SJW1-29]
MLKTYIVEDNALELANVLDFLALKCPQVKVVGTSGEMESAYVGIIETRPDLLISDIQIIGGLCYDLLKRLKKVDRLNELRIIFMTRFRDFDNAKHGYEYSPLAFLEKPFTAGELHEAVDKVGQPREIPQARQQMELFLEFLSNQAHPGQRLTVTLLKGALQLVDLNDIVYLEANGSMTDLYLKDIQSPLVSSRNLGHYAALLHSNGQFFSISKSILINLTHLDRYDHSEKRIVFRHSARHVYASRSGGQELRQYLLQNPQPKAQLPDPVISFFRKLFGLK